MTLRGGEELEPAEWLRCRAEPERVLSCLSSSARASVGLIGGYAEAALLCAPAELERARLTEGPDERFRLSAERARAEEGMSIGDGTNFRPAELGFPPPPSLEALRDVSFSSDSLKLHFGGGAPRLGLSPPDRSDLPQSCGACSGTFETSELKRSTLDWRPRGGVGPAFAFGEGPASPHRMWENL
mmetsp:Transcript_156493/g.284703  ORF Transcript_156493/g.284703 Transcript_156493/m.284703 type:complete len:185 (+) Transcript_156493:841-1395(+)